MTPGTAQSLLQHQAIGPHKPVALDIHRGPLTGVRVDANVGEGEEDVALLPALAHGRVAEPGLDACARGRWSGSGWVRRGPQHKQGRSGCCTRGQDEQSRTGLLPQEQPTDDAAGEHTTQAVRGEAGAKDLLDLVLQHHAALVAAQVGHGDGVVACA